jgi:hypothetical protein
VGAISGVGSDSREPVFGTSPGSLVALRGCIASVPVCLTRKRSRWHKKNPVIGIYQTSQQAEIAVDKLIQAGFQAGDISVLHPDNQSSRDFADKKHTRHPRGTVQGESASAPLEGTLGLADPAQGPIRGALSEALNEMGIPPDWPCVERVLNGDILFSVPCHTLEESGKAIEVLQKTGAENIDSVQPGE